MAREQDFDFDRFRFVHEAMTLTEPCVDVVLYWAGDVHDHANGIVEFYLESLSHIRQELKYFRTETMGAARRLRNDSLDLVPYWLRPDADRRDIYMMYLESGTNADAPSAFAFAMNASPGKGFVRLVLPPATAASEALPQYLDLALKLGRTLDFDSGYAGFSLNWNPLGKQTRRPIQHMSTLASRYPGLDIPRPETTEYIVTTGIKCVNWLTFVGPSYVAQLGGLDELQIKLSPPVIVHQINNGVAIQAGHAPQLGDVNRGDALPVYHEVGRALAPVRALGHPPMFGPRGVHDRDVTDQWLARFDT